MAAPATPLRASGTPADIEGLSKELSKVFRKQKSLDLLDLHKIELVVRTHGMNHITLGGWLHICVFVCVVRALPSSMGFRYIDG